MTVVVPSDQLTSNMYTCTYKRVTESQDHHKTETKTYKHQHRNVMVYDTESLQNYYVHTQSIIKRKDSSIDLSLKGS